MVPSTERLSKLRSLMADRGLQAYFVPSEDAHQVCPGRPGAALTV